MADTVFVRMRAVQNQRALCRVLVCMCILRLAAHAQVITPPKQLKQVAVAALQGISTGDKDLQKKIGSALNDISQSLSTKTTNFFLDDWRILPPPNGVQVFDQEQKAADELKGLLKDKNTPAGIRSTLQGVLNTLVQADREIAERSLVTAERFVKAGEGDARVVTRARQQFDQAAKETDPKESIDGFKNAWQSSQEVANQNGLVITSFTDGPGLFSSRITSNKLTATFQIIKNDNGDGNGNSNKKDNRDNKNNNDSNRPGKPSPQQSIEFIEIIQDASTGATIRNITTSQVAPPLPQGGDDSSKLPAWSVTLTSSWDGKDNSGQIAMDGTYNYVAFARIVNPGDGKNGNDEKKDYNKDDNNGKNVVAVAFPVSAGVTLDSTPPNITAVRDKPPNAAGWNNTDVTVNFTCSDALDAVTCPAPVTVTAEGANQRVSGTAVDVAGNTGTVTVILNIDKTPPLIAAVEAPSPNARGWNNLNVTVSFAASDALSGLANVTAPVVIQTEGANQRITGTAVDVAGNVATAVATVNLDKTPPTLTFGVAAPGPNAAGWNNTNVAFSFTAADNLSGVAGTSVPSPLILSAEGSAVTGSVTVTDVAGNSATFTSPAVKIDKTPPTAQAAASPQANAAGWNNTNVTVSFTGTDTLSGIASCSAPLVLSTEGRNQSASGTCTDNAGNISQTASVTGINIDKTPPVLIISSPQNGVTVADPTLAVTGTATDTLSGVATVSCNASAATVFTSGAFSCSITLSSGENSIVVTATDVAGNVSTTNLRVTFSPLPPSLLSVNPNAGQVGQTLAHVIITGKNTHFVQGATIARFGADISIGGGAVGAFGFVSVSSPTSATAQVAIDPKATIGTRNVEVETGTEKVSIADGFSVTAGPPIGELAVSPTVVFANTPTVVTVTLGIFAPTLIPTNPNLVRLGPNGETTILGVLHDDGRSGDTMAGDGVFTLQVVFNEVAGTLINLQVAVHFTDQVAPTVVTAPAIFVDQPSAPAQTISALVTALQTNNINSALSFFSDLGQAARILPTLDAQSLANLATMFGTAQLNRISGDLRIYSQVGSTQLEFVLAPDDSGNWQVVIW